MLGHAPLSAAPLAAFPVTEPVVFSPTDIILWPVGVTADICLRDPAYVDPCLPVTPVNPPGPGGGTVIWHGPTHRSRKSPWEPTKTLVPTSRRPTRSKADLVKLQEQDDLEVVRVLATFLGHL